MGYRLMCKTLFDITMTGMIYRNKPADMDQKVWLAKRNSQCNLDTILQAISLRSLPEITSSPVIEHLMFKDTKFGHQYKQYDGLNICWAFEFLVQDVSVFYDGDTELAFLYQDCHQVPMIICNTMVENVSSFLDISDIGRNIYFEVVGHE
jgi:hypothetical protein